MANYVATITYKGTDYGIKASSLNTNGQPSGLAVLTDGNGGITFGGAAGGVAGIQSGGTTYTGTITLGTGLSLSGTTTNGTMVCDGVRYTQEPPASNKSSGVGFVIMTQPAGSFTTKSGWLYFILEPQ